MTRLYCCSTCGLASQAVNKIALKFLYEFSGPSGPSSFAAAICPGVDGNAKISQRWLEKSKTSWSSRSLPTWEAHLGSSRPNPLAFGA